MIYKAIIEIPTGTNEKWEVQEDGGLKQDMLDGKPRSIKYLSYPANYGMIPNTLLSKENGGDGDPLDVFVLGSRLVRAQNIDIKVVGYIDVMDGDERDCKLIAINNDKNYLNVNTLQDLYNNYPGIIEILILWLSNYKNNDKVKVLSVEDEVKAAKLIEDSYV